MADTAWVTIRPPTHRTDVAPVRKPPAASGGPWSITAPVTQITPTQNVRTQPHRLSDALGEILDDVGNDE